MLQCWRRTEVFALFSRPHPGGFDSSRVPTPGNLPCKAKKKKANAWGSARRGGGGGLGATGIDWCITIGTHTITSVFLPAIILYFTDAGRIKQRILCCRKFIIIFGSSDLFIEQLLALAECRLRMFSFRAWQKYYILSLLRREYWSIFVRKRMLLSEFLLYPLTIRHFKTRLFKKSGEIR